MRWRRLLWSIHDGEEWLVCCCSLLAQEKEVIRATAVAARSSFGDNDNEKQTTVRCSDTKAGFQLVAVASTNLSFTGGRSFWGCGDFRARFDDQREYARTPTSRYGIRERPRKIMNDDRRAPSPALFIMFIVLCVQY